MPPTLIELVVCALYALGSMVEKKLDNVEQIVFGIGLKVILNGPKSVTSKFSKNIQAGIGPGLIRNMTLVYAVVAEPLLKHAIRFQTIECSGKKTLEFFQCKALVRWALSCSD